DRNLFGVHGLQEGIAELGELAFAQLAEGDVLAAGRNEQAELVGVNAAERLNGPVDERDSAVWIEASLLYEDAVEFEEEALLVGDLGHSARRVLVGVGGCRGRPRLPMASAQSRPGLKFREKRPAVAWARGPSTEPVIAARFTHRR